jgi:uncharacterized protein with FMN-binding domain
VLPAQTAAAAPADAVAAGLIVSINELVTAGHVPAGSLVVIVSVTDPALISAAEGVYVVFTLDALAKVPVPEVVQVEDVALPPMDPLRVAVLPEQIVCADPAAAVAAGLIVKVIKSVAAEQGPAGSLVVMVKVTDPAAMSAAEGVYVVTGVLALANVPLPLVVQVDELAPPL